MIDNIRFSGFAVTTAGSIEPTIQTHFCQSNVGTEMDPRPCGRKLTKINDWTYECPACGEVH